MMRSASELAKELGISHMTVRRCRARETYGRDQ